MSLTIAVDVDNTFLPTDKYWYKWLESMSCSKARLVEKGQNVVFESYEAFESFFKAHNRQANYYLPTYFPEMKNKNVHPLDFFRNEGCYDMCKPYDHVVKILRELQADGHRIVFVTHNKGNGSRSKYNLLSRHCDFPFDYVVTKEKDLIRADILVDDRLEFLNRCKGTSTTPVMFETIYSQTTRDDKTGETTILKENQNIYTINSWNDFVSVLILVL